MYWRGLPAQKSKILTIILLYSTSTVKRTRYLILDIYEVKQTIPQSLTTYQLQPIYQLQAVTSSLF